MPITQQRMISLVNAAMDYVQALDAVREMLERTSLAVQHGELDAKEAMSMLGTEIDASRLLHDPRNSYAIIAVEKRHFQLAWKRNERRAAKIAEKRGGLQGAGTAPRSITDTGQQINPDNIRVPVQKRELTQEEREYAESMKAMGYSGTGNTSVEKEAEKDQRARKGTNVLEEGNKLGQDFEGELEI